MTINRGKGCCLFLYHFVEPYLKNFEVLVLSERCIGRDFGRGPELGCLGTVNCVVDLPKHGRARRATQRRGNGVVFLVADLWRAPRRDFFCSSTSG